MSGNELSGGNQGIQINSGFDAHSVQHIKQVLGGNISGSAFGIGATTETSHRAVNHGDPALQRRQNIGQRLAVGVMKMYRQLRNRNLFGDRFACPYQ